MRRLFEKPARLLQAMKLKSWCVQKKKKKYWIRKGAENSATTFFFFLILLVLLEKCRRRSSSHVRAWAVWDGHGDGNFNVGGRGGRFTSGLETIYVRRWQRCEGGGAVGNLCVHQLRLLRRCAPETRRGVAAVTSRRAWGDLCDEYSSQQDYMITPIVWPSRKTAGLRHLPKQRNLLPSHCLGWNTMVGLKVRY